MTKIRLFLATACALCVAGVGITVNFAVSGETQNALVMGVFCALTTIPMIVVGVTAYRDEREAWAAYDDWARHNAD